MDALRPTSVLLSTVFHGALLLSMMQFTGSNAFEAGTGTDQLRIEQGMAIEGLSRLGEAPETIEARDAETVPSTVAQAALDEVKAVEPEQPKEIAAVEPQQTPPPPDAIVTEKPSEVEDVVASPLGETREVLTARPPQPEEVKPEPLKEIAETPPLEVRPPQPKQVASEEQVEQVAVIEQQAAAQARDGGDAAAYRQFLGALHRHIEKFRVKPTVRPGQKLESGRTDLVVEIDRNGRVVEAVVYRSSGSARLDALAIESVRRAEPYPVEAKFIPDATLKLTIPFAYTVRQ
ncbi:MAG: TonB family protein [Hyphomicrobiaceae bacterium]